MPSEKKTGSKTGELGLGVGKGDPHPPVHCDLLTSQSFM